MFDNVSEVHLVWHFLNFNKKLTSKRTEEQLENLKKEIINLIDCIESAKEFPANPGPLCGWCEFKNHCKKNNTSFCSNNSEKGENNY